MKDEYKEMVCRVRFIDGVPAKTYLSDVEIVRCKDCKHWQKSSINYNEYVCYWGGYVKQEDDYCSCAERKEHETD